MECLFKFGVVFLMCIVTCYGMSRNEIEDFRNFLEKASNLDQNVKSYDADDDNHISDDAWEESGKFEGDIILNERQRKAIVEEVAEGLSRNAQKDITKRWPDNVLIYYIQREHFNGEQVQAIEDGMESLARDSCVKFRPYRKGDRDAVVIQGSRRGCFSRVGYQGGYQVLNLYARHQVGRGCFKAGTIVHELLHSLGFYHMQSSPDRDDYIDVKWENIHEQAKHNFKKYNSLSVSDFGVGYDYDSVLHYGRKAFTNNGQDTLIPKQSGARIGQRFGLSEKDTLKLNKMYCDADTNNNDDTQPIHRKTVLKVPSNKNKKHKNPPFSGHGIGYHQGKTIAIKLPNAQTMRLIVVPSIYMYDYSRRTQALPATPYTQGFGAGKEVTKTFEPFKFNHHSEKENTPLRNELKHSNSTLSSTNSKNNDTENTQSKESKNESSDDNSGNEETSEEIHLASEEDLENAFNKLRKLFNDQSITKNESTINLDYSEFYNPKSDSVNENFKTMDPSRSKGVKVNENGEVHDLNKVSVEKVRKYIDKLHEPETSLYFTLDDKKVENQEDVEALPPDTGDASFRTTYPFRLYDFDKKYHGSESRPAYDPFSKFSKVHQYESIYYSIPNTEIGSAVRAHKDIFGQSSLPLDDNEWYRKDELNDTPLRYNKDRYTYYSPEEREVFPEKIKGSATSDSTESSKDTHSGYTIFGDPVPTGQQWYNVGPLSTDVLYEDKSSLLTEEASSEEHT